MPETLYPIPSIETVKAFMTVIRDNPPLPALWYEPAPRHFDLSAPWWSKMLLIAGLTILALLFFDAPIAVFFREHARSIPDLARDASQGYRGGDVGRDLMFLEQWGQWVCSVVVILAVAVLDPKGRRRALAIAIGCLLTFLVTHLMKDLIGRSRPFVAPTSADGHWIWGGPGKGFHGSSWGSFPSAHTTGAFALAAGLAWFYPRGRGLFMGLAVITAAQRVLHTAHYVSDVIAGIGIGVGVARWTLGAKLAGRILALLPAEWQAWWAREQNADKDFVQQN